MTRRKVTHFPPPAPAPSEFDPLGLLPPPPKTGAATRRAIRELIDALPDRAWHGSVDRAWQRLLDAMIDDVQEAQAREERARTSGSAGGRARDPVGVAERHAEWRAVAARWPNSTDSAAAGHVLDTLAADPTRDPGVRLPKERIVRKVLAADRSWRR